MTSEGTTGDTIALRRIRTIGAVLAVLTFMLIVWGGHVNTTRSGMAFPDWPTSNAAPMMTYAPSKWLWEGDKFWEHGHRLFASVVGLVTTILLVVVYRSVPRGERPHGMIAGFVSLVFATIVTAIFGVHSMPAGFMESFMVMLAASMIGFAWTAGRSSGTRRLLWLALAAFAAVCLQGAFGGYTVRNNLPAWTSTTHGMLAELFLMTVVGITFLAHRLLVRWDHGTVSRAVRTMAAATWVLTFVQFFLGALTRHTESWGVSVSFPHWDASGFFPSADLFQYGQVLIHFTHRTMAYAVAVTVVLQWWLVRRQSSAPHQLRKLTLAAAVIVLVQVLLGAAILWTARGELVTTLHVMTGVGLLVLNTLSLYTALASPMQSSVAVPLVTRQQQG